MEDFNNVFEEVKEITDSYPNEFVGTEVNEEQIRVQIERRERRIQVIKKINQKNQHIIELIEKKSEEIYEEFKTEISKRKKSTKAQSGGQKKKLLDKNHINASWIKNQSISDIFDISEIHFLNYKNYIIFIQCVLLKIFHTFIKYKVDLFNFKDKNATIYKIFAIFDYFNIFKNFSFRDTPFPGNKKPQVTPFYWQCYYILMEEGLDAIFNSIDNNKNLLSFFLDTRNLDYKVVETEVNWVASNPKPKDIIYSDVYKLVIKQLIQQVDSDSLITPNKNENSPIYKLRKIRNFYI